MIISLFEDLGYATVEVLREEHLSPEDLSRLQRIFLATTDALERLLGAPPGYLQPASLEGLEQWMAT